MSILGYWVKDSVWCKPWTWGKKHFVKLDVNSFAKWASEIFTLDEDEFLNRNKEPPSNIKRKIYKAEGFL